MSITMDHRLVAARPRPVSGIRHVRRPTPQWLEFVGFFLAFLVLVCLSMAFRFYVYGPADIWSRLVQVFG